MQVIQNRVTRLLSPVLQVLCLGLVVLTDAARLWRDPVDFPPGEEGVHIWGIGMTVFLAVLATTLLMLFWKSRIVISNEHVQVVNPIRTYGFHLSQLEKVDTEFVEFPRLHVSGRVIRAVGVHHSLRMHLFRSEHRLTKALDDLAERAREVEPGPSGVEIGRRSITPTELGFAAVWILLITVELVKYAG